MSDISHQFGSWALWLATAIGPPAFCPSPSDDPRVDIEKVEAQALEAAARIEKEENRARALTELAKGQAMLGRVDAMRTTLVGPIAFAKGLDEDRGHIRRRAAHALALAGLDDEAAYARRRLIAEARARDDGGQADAQFSELAQRAILDGDFAMALECVAALPPTAGPRRAAGFLEVANSAARLGRLEVARDAMARFGAIAPKDPADLPGGLAYLHAATLARMSREIAQAGRRDEARGRLAEAEAVGGPRPTFTEALVQAEFAAAHHALGEEDKAEAAVARADAVITALAMPQQKVVALRAISELLVEGGMAVAARRRLAEASRIAGEAGALTGLRQTATTLAALGDWGPAREAIFPDLKAAQPMYAQLDSLAAFARSQARAGEARAALDWIERVEQPDPKAYLLAGLLQGLAERLREKPPR